MHDNRMHDIHMCHCMFESACVYVCACVCVCVCVCACVCMCVYMCVCRDVLCISHLKLLLTIHSVINRLKDDINFLNKNHKAFSHPLTLQDIQYMHV